MFSFLNLELINSFYINKFLKNFGKRNFWFDTKDLNVSINISELNTI